MNIMYSNISGGLIFAGKTYGEMLFSRISLEKYIEYFQSKKIDILSLSEVHLEGKTSSDMVERIAKGLGLEHHASLALSNSHLDTSKKLGMAVISRYPIVSQEEFVIPSPKLEVVRPDGERWVMFDKGGQRVILDIDGVRMGLVNFSYFPFHHFGRRVDEPEFALLRKQLLNVLLRGDQEMPTIVTGDFNNKGVLLADAFSELFENNTVAQAVRVKSTVVGFDDQLDHILYQPRFFSAADGFAEDNGSDHLVVGARLVRR